MNAYLSQGDINYYLMIFTANVLKKTWNDQSKLILNHKSGIGESEMACLDGSN